MAEPTDRAVRFLHGLVEVMAGRRDENELCSEYGVGAVQLEELKRMAARLAGADRVGGAAPPAREEAARPQAASAPTRNTIVRARNLRRTYRLGHQDVHALNGVNLEVFRGEYMSIMGPSGSGKTTLFNMLGALDKPTDGHIFIDEVDVAQLTAAELAWLRCRKIGYIFQTFNIIPVMTSLENVMLPIIFADVHPDIAREKAVTLLRRVGLGDRITHRPYELSGGQQQRVAIARSLANGPAIILADEPTGNLDTSTGEEIIFLLRELNQEHGVTVITATHDMKMLSVSDRIVWIRDGRIDRIELRENLTIETGGLKEH